MRMVPQDRGRTNRTLLATGLEEKEKEKCVGDKTRDNSSTDNMDGKRIRPGVQMFAIHDYKKNPESPAGCE